jgi:hypothetical protein
MDAVMRALHFPGPPKGNRDPALVVAAELVTVLAPYGIRADVHPGTPVTVSVCEGLVVTVRAGGLSWYSPDAIRDRPLKRIRYTAHAALDQLLADHSALTRGQYAS